MREIEPGDIVQQVVSPAFALRAPLLRHGERIPAAVRALMQGTWEQGWFAPRPVRVCVLEDVFVCQQGLVFTAAGELLRASIREHSPQEIEAGRTAIRAAGAPRLRGDLVLARKRGAANYGHWIVETLPMAWLAARHWPHPLRFLVQALPPPMRGVMLQSLARLGVSPDRVVAAWPAPVRVDRLLLVDGLSAHDGRDIFPVA